MSRFLGEALFIGIKEKPLLAGVGTVFLASFAALTVPVTVEVRDVVVKLIGYVFGLFFLFSLGALYQTTGTDMLGPLKSVFTKRLFLFPLIYYFLSIIYFIPDMAGSSLYIKDLYSMAGGRPVIFGAAGAGFVFSLFAFFLAARKIKADITKLFDLPQMLLFLALIKLVAGGVRGFAELSLISAVQAGLMKLVHDMVHQTFLFIMVPDHTLLKTTTWNFIGFLFGNTMGLWLSLFIIIFPLVLFLKKHFAMDVSVPAGVPRGPQEDLHQIDPR